MDGPLDYCPIVLNGIILLVIVIHPSILSVHYLCSVKCKASVSICTAHMVVLEDRSNFLCLVYIPAYQCFCYDGNEINFVML